MFPLLPEHSEKKKLKDNKRFFFSACFHYTFTLSFLFLAFVSCNCLAHWRPFKWPSHLVSIYINVSFCFLDASAFPFPSLTPLFSICFGILRGPSCKPQEPVKSFQGPLYNLQWPVYNAQNIYTCHHHLQWGWQTKSSSSSWADVVKKDVFEMVGMSPICRRTRFARWEQRCMLFFSFLYTALKLPFVQISTRKMKHNMQKKRKIT